MFIASIMPLNVTNAPIRVPITGTSMLACVVHQSKASPSFRTSSPKPLKNEPLPLPCKPAVNSSMYILALFTAPPTASPSSTLIVRPKLANALPASSYFISLILCSASSVISISLFTLPRAKTPSTPKSSHIVPKRFTPAVFCAIGSFIFCKPCTT